MYRYIAFSWNVKDPAKTAVAQRLTRLLLSISLDRLEMEKLLSERELILCKDPKSVLSCVLTEAWLGTWAEVRQRTVA